MPSFLCLVLRTPSITNSRNWWRLSFQKEQTWERNKAKRGRVSFHACTCRALITVITENSQQLCLRPLSHLHGFLSIFRRSVPVWHTTTTNGACLPFPFITNLFYLVSRFSKIPLPIITNIRKRFHFISISLSARASAPTRDLF